jgi:hypothetical protein
MLAMNFSTPIQQQASHNQQPHQPQQQPQMMQQVQQPALLFTRSAGSIPSGHSAAAFSFQGQQQQPNGLVPGVSWNAPSVAMTSPLQQQQPLEAGKRGRSGRCPHHEQPPPQEQQTAVFPGHAACTSAPLADSDNDKTPHHDESSRKKRRPSNYVAPRTIPTTFTSVTGTLVGPANLRRNLSFSRIDPYVSYAQTPSLNNFNSSVNTGDMDMDSSNYSVNMPSTSDGQNRVRSMSL